MSEVRVYKKDNYTSRLNQVIDDIKTLVNDICNENDILKDTMEQLIAPISVIDNPKSELAANIVQWVENGDLVLRAEMGARSVIARKIKHGELFPTSYGAILATNKGVRDIFEAYIRNHRVMDVNKLAVHYGLTTRFAVEQSVKKGELQKIDCFGTNITLYVI